MQDNFKTPQEEIKYLRKLLEDKQQELDEADRNFADFQLFSKQLEDEMEQELQGAEKKYADLEGKYKRLRDEYEKMMDKSSTQSKESSLLISTLQEELNKLTQQRNSLQKDLRRTEQENDTLERRERMLTASVADMQERLEKVMEENVWVQSELDEHHAQSDESVQRLRDEIRDLKLELAIKERNVGSLSRSESPAHLGKREHLLPAEDMSPRPPKSPRRHAGTPSFSAPPIAIGMVSDMLNLVKELEVRIATYKSNKSLLSPPASPRIDSQGDANKGTRLKFSFSNPELKLTDLNILNDALTPTSTDGADLRLVHSSESESESESSTMSDNLDIRKKGEVPT